MSWLIPVVGVVGFWLFLQGISMPRRARISFRVEPYLSGLHGRPSSLLQRSLRTTPVRKKLGELLHRLFPYGDEDLRRRLSEAGDDRRPEDLRLEQLMWALTAAVFATLIVGTFALAGAGLQISGLPVLFVLAFLGGFLGRDWWLGRQIERRRALIASELPVALDLIALAIMAGESVPAAFERVAPRLGTGLGSELRTVIDDIRGGAPTVEAIEGLGRRIPEASLARFVDAICTGIERGAPLSDVLRGQADDARDARRRRLLELGGKREVAMLVPVVFLVMPVVVLFALFPGLVSLQLLVP